MSAYYLVRHGVMRLIGEFEAPSDTLWRRQQQVLVRSERGTEVGTILGLATERARQFLVEPTSGHILRDFTSDDQAHLQRLREFEKHAFQVGTRCIQQRALQMDLVDVEQLFGGERVIFYFLVRPPEKRVDFRELVRDLARELQTRIELRQIGARDEAKILADYGDCGKPVCCNTHLTVMPPVSMRMAKLQKSTLDPSKISGRCGRLKCCLRYEFNVYDEFQRALPPPGARVLTRKGQGRVLAQEILARRLLVEFEDGRRLLIAADDVLTPLGTEARRSGVNGVGEESAPSRGRSRDSGKKAAPRPPESPPSQDDDSLLE
jgi:cell fate regulator YaaT (PSP1 superfamily)